MRKRKRYEGIGGDFCVTAEAVTYKAEETVARIRSGPKDASRQTPTLCLRRKGWGTRKSGIKRAGPANSIGTRISRRMPNALQK